MATSESKASFLTWNLSRSSTPKPEAERDKKDETLKGAGGTDHSISHRPPPSLRKYPKDCPPLRTRWFYAVDVPKRKPFSSGQDSQDKAKAPPQPKKLVPFVISDSQEIEAAFQSLADEQESSNSESANDSSPVTPSRRRVPVNEDFLFDVDIENRELEPAYWIGPVYEVRRGSWFYAETPLRPCDENLANQLEEGYLKVRPWLKTSEQAQRSSSQPRSRPSSLIVDKPIGETASSTPATPRHTAVDARVSRPDLSSNNIYRLFGAYMNSTATYQDATTAWLTSDDFMSRMSITVYQRFGTVGGTKLVRGYAEPGRTDGKVADESTSPAAKRKSAPPGTLTSPVASEDPKSESEERSDEQFEPKRTALERQLSSLAGVPGENSAELAEEARQQEEKEMEDYRETDGEEQNRNIDHLVLVTHGIGQRLGLRLDSINFVHDVNTMRKSIKAVYANSPDLQALNSQMDELPKNSRIQVLPVCWRHMLDFPKQSLRQNRKETDLADMYAIDEDEYPSLADITVDGVPAVRNLITDLAMDVLLYQSAYREHIAGIVQQECNRIFKLFKERNPSFSGRVSLIGHSLGSAILFDILCRQRDAAKPTLTNRKQGNARTRADTYESLKLDLDFDCENFFCLGSPIALFQMLKGRTIVGRQQDVIEPPNSPFDSDPMDDHFLGAAAGSAGQKAAGSKPSHLIPISISSPKCQELYNIFHPTDPISYRMEPLISPAMSSMKPQPLPYTKQGLFGAPGFANIGARMGQSVGSMWYNFTSGVASSLLNRSLGLTGEEQALVQDGKTPAQLRAQTQSLANNASTGKGPMSTTSPTLVADAKRQQQVADEANQNANVQPGEHAFNQPDHLPTLIDSELETLYGGFRKRRLSQQSDQFQDQVITSAEISEADLESEERARKFKREEAKVRALNSNGRVDYSIQEGVFDISLLASIASHLSYWSDEDVNHFMISQMLSKGRKEGEVGGDKF